MHKSACFLPKPAAQQERWLADAPATPVPAQPRHTAGGLRFAMRQRSRSTAAPSAPRRQQFRPTNFRCRGYRRQACSLILLESMADLLQHMRESGFLFPDRLIHLFVGGSELHGAKV